MKKYIHETEQWVYGIIVVACAVALIIGVTLENLAIVEVAVGVYLASMVLLIIRKFYWH